MFTDYSLAQEGEIIAISALYPTIYHNIFMYAYDITVKKSNGEVVKDTVGCTDKYRLKERVYKGRKVQVIGDRVINLFR